MSQSVNIGESELKNAVRCAIEGLSSELLPEMLKCLTSARKNYLDTLTNFVKGCQELARTEFFLLSGTPGVGKTFLARYLMWNLAKEGFIIPVYLNCFELDTSSSVHEIILSKVCSSYGVSLRHAREGMKHADNSPLSSQSLLEKFCKCGWQNVRNEKANRIILLVLDEIDLLTMQKHQPIGVLFSILDLLRYPKSNILILGISNQVGIPAFQEPKLLSRINGQLIFKSYTETELLNLMVRRMELYHGVIAPFLEEKSTPSALRKLDIFSHHAMQIIFRSFGLQGDMRQAIHGCKHVLIQFLEENEGKWNEILNKVRRSTIFTCGKYNRNDGLIDTEFTFRSLEKIKTSSIRPELINLPFMGYVVLAISLRVQLLRPKTSLLTRKYSTDQQTSPCEISIDTLAEAMYCIALRIRNMIQHFPYDSSASALNLDIADQLENLSGLQWTIQALRELNLIELGQAFNNDNTRGVIRLNIEPSVLRRALEDSKYCLYTDLVKLI